MEAAAGLLLAQSHEEVELGASSMVSRDQSYCRPSLALEHEPSMHPYAWRSRRCPCHSLLRSHSPSARHPLHESSLSDWALKSEVVVEAAVAMSMETLE